jgi:hypothetical protein
MSNRVDLYNSTYGNFKEQALAEVRRETYGEDIGQNSWLTAEEYDKFYRWLELAPELHVLEVASGSGGPAPVKVTGSVVKDGKPFLTKEPKLLLNDNNAGKVEGIHMMIGRRPYAAFGNSTGDRQMLEWTGAGAGARLKMLVLHDDAAREYAYGPAQGLPDSKVGTFTQALYDEAKKDGWTVISMKNDWKRIFPFHN